MKDLVYRIGAIEIDPAKFNGVFVGGSYYANHRFVVGTSDNIVSIYVANLEDHPSVVRRFRKTDSFSPVGGGKCYLDKNRNFVLDDYSGTYGGIPKIVAITFGGLILPELRLQGIEVNKAIAKPRGRLNHFWIDRGFTK